MSQTLSSERNVIAVLQERGFINQLTETGLPEAAAKERLTLYCGFDPTAPSLQVGNLVPVFAMAHFQRHGHRVIALVGGGTGMIGDPSGKSEERALLSLETVAENAERQRAQLARFLEFDGPNAAIVENNINWLGSWRLVDFLRDVGKHFTVNTMLAKESVRARIESREQGLSFTEFSYMLLQAADYLHLHRSYGCNLQVGGSDQWGNITAGVELIRRVTGTTVHGLTFPLITTASGAKLGKSEGNAIYLDPEMTSPYQFYQYWINTDDRDVIRFLKLFTFLSLEDIAGLEEQMRQAPEQRIPQRVLAYEFTRIVHGEDVARSVQTVSQILFGQTTAPLAELLNDRVVGLLAGEVPTLHASGEQLEEGLPVVDAAVGLGLARSKSQARQLIQQGGLSVNGAVCTDLGARIGEGELIGGRAALVRVGKRHYGLVLRRL